MRVVGFDTETKLIRPACLAPQLVCVTWQWSGGAPQIVPLDLALPILEEILRADRIVGHNVAYDMGVIAEAFPGLRRAVFNAYDEDRVTDTQIRQQLLDIAAGCYRGSVSAKGKRRILGYTLEELARRCANIELQKDEWRLSYGEFLGIPLSGWADKARELQAAARVRLAELEARDVTKDDQKAHDKAVASLRSMIEGDPERARTYPLDDARATLAVYLAQEKHAAYLADQFRQVRAAFALHLNSCWGLRTDAEGVQRLRAAIEAEHEEVDEEMRELGLVRENGVRDTKAAKRLMIRLCAEEEIPVVRTDAHFAEKKTWAQRLAEGEAENAALIAAGKKPKKVKPRCTDIDGKPLDDGHDDCAEHICLDADACERTGDDVMMAYAERTTLGKQLSNDIPALEKGTEYPVHTRYGLAGTGRSTSSKPNIQNQSKRAGFREAFVPRPGMLFAEADFPTLELYTLAQCCVSWLGESKLAAALNGGMDPHLWVAAIILGTTYEDALKNKKDPEVKKARQLAKPANFGFPGGMGITKFVASTRKSVIKQDGRAAWEAMGLDEPRAKKLKDEWLTAWPEMGRYFKRVRDLCDNDSNLATAVTLFTNRTRGRATYCATANNGFQAMGADCAKEAAWRIARAQYVGTPSLSWEKANPGTLSPLFNARGVAFVHDEFISEVPDNDTAHDAAYEQAALMVEGANIYLPDVPIPMSKMEPLLMRRWAKSAVSTFDASGRLIPWAA